MPLFFAIAVAISIVLVLVLQPRPRIDDAKQLESSLFEPGLMKPFFHLAGLKPLHHVPELAVKKTV